MVVALPPGLSVRLRWEALAENQESKCARTLEQEAEPPALIVLG